MSIKPPTFDLKKMSWMLTIFLCVNLFGAVNVYADGLTDSTGFSTIRLSSALNPFLVERDLWHDARISVESNVPGFSLHEVDIRLRGRGNTTWWFGSDKRPLRFRFDVPLEMLGVGTPHRDWILLANHFDQSLLRNYAALHLGRQLSGLDNTPRSRFVHLYVNGQYMGVYQLTDERDLGPGRTNIVLHEDPAISEFMLEWDDRMRGEPFRGLDWILTSTDIPFDIRFPSGSDTSPAHAAYALDFLERVSKALRSGNFEGFSSLVDIPSFVDFYLVQEFMKNPDVHFSSVFMTIRGQGSERRLVMGPLWDFDLAAGGNRVYGAIEYRYSPYGITAALRNYWFRYAMKMPEFNHIVTRRWNEIRRVEINNTISRIVEIQRLYATDFERNFVRHQILGTRVWNETDEIVAITTHEGQAAHLAEWLESRANWLDGHFNPYSRSRLDVLRSFLSCIMHNKGE